ncbi:hypothetical protein [Phascolarctobacterium sp.]
MSKSTIEKQIHNKYDNKQRKSQEKKTERLNFRVSPETKASFTKLQTETGLPQGTLFESLISNNHLSIIQNGSLIAKELAGVSQQLNTVNMCIRQGNNGLLIDQLQQVNITLNNIQKLLLQAVGGIRNGNL